MITTQQLRTIQPYVSQANAELYAPILNTYASFYLINTKYRQAAFLAQVMHESGSLAYTTELASGAAYEGRADLGNTQKGDGVRFKGRGLIQLTGRSNYTTLSKAFGVDFVKQPELLALPANAVKSACWFWHNKGLNELADEMQDQNEAERTETYKQITKRINGGYNGLAQRLSLFAKALQVL